jgi:hypothetical protein
MAVIDDVVACGIGAALILDWRSTACYAGSPCSSKHRRLEEFQAKANGAFHRGCGIIRCVGSTIERGAFIESGLMQSQGSPLVLTVSKTV